MATTTGKAARRTGGNRYACKRHSRHTNPMKAARWNAQNPEARKAYKAKKARAAQA